MNNIELEQLKIRINNLLRLRDNCMGFIGLVASGVLGLLISKFSFLKLGLMTIGTVVLFFLFLMINVIDNNINTKTREMTK